MSTPRVVLSKSLYVKGYRCPKLLWLSQNKPELASPLSDSDKARMSEGTRIGELARQLWPKGILISKDFEEALAATQKAMSTDDAPAIFEGAFLANETRIRVDILARGKGQSFDLSTPPVLPYLTNRLPPDLKFV